MMVQDGLEELREEVLACRRCLLALTRVNAVPGEGSTGYLMLVGEAPGRDEDMTGRPFVGRAGKLLEDALREAGLKRGDLYITNVVKCRPPKNRKPNQEEIKTCMPFLEREVDLVKPRAVVAMGATAVNALTGQKAVFSIRGKFFRYHGVPVIVTLHPAFALRNPRLKALIVSDLEEARRIAEATCPSTRCVAQGGRYPPLGSIALRRPSLLGAVKQIPGAYVVQGAGGAQRLLCPTNLPAEPYHR